MLLRTVSSTAFFCLFSSLVSEGEGERLARSGLRCLTCRGRLVNNVGLHEMREAGETQAGDEFEVSFDKTEEDNGVEDSWKALENIVHVSESAVNT